MVIFPPNKNPLELKFNPLPFIWFSLLNQISSNLGGGFVNTFNSLTVKNVK